LTIARSAGARRIAAAFARARAERRAALIPYVVAGYPDADTSFQVALAAADAGRFCIGAGSDAFLTGVAARPCLLSSAITRVDRAVETVVREAWQGRWQAGPRAFGVIEGGVGLAPFHEHESTVSAEIRARLETITQQLASGQLLDGN